MTEDLIDRAIWTAKWALVGVGLIFAMMFIAFPIGVGLAFAWEMIVTAITDFLTGGAQ